MISEEIVKDISVCLAARIPSKMSFYLATQPFSNLVYNRYLTYVRQENEAGNPVVMSLMNFAIHLLRGCDSEVYESYKSCSQTTEERQLQQHMVDAANALRDESLADIYDSFLTKSRAQLLSDLVCREEVRVAVDSAIRASLGVPNSVDYDKNLLFNKFLEIFTEKGIGCYQFENSIIAVAVHAASNFYVKSHKREFTNIIYGKDDFAISKACGKPRINELEIPDPSIDPVVRQMVIEIAEYNHDEFSYSAHGELSRRPIYDTYYGIMSLMCQRYADEISKDLGLQIEIVDPKLYLASASSLPPTLNGVEFETRDGIHDKIRNKMLAIGRMTVILLNGVNTLKYIPEFRTAVLTLSGEKVSNNTSARTFESKKSDAGLGESYTRINAITEQGRRVSGEGNYITFEHLLNATASALKLMKMVEQSGKFLVDSYNPEIFLNPAVSRSVDRLSSFDYVDDILKHQRVPERLLLQDAKNRENNTNARYQEDLDTFDNLIYFFAGSPQSTASDKKENIRYDTIHGMLGDAKIKDSPTFKDDYEKLLAVRINLTSIPRSLVEYLTQPEVVPNNPSSHRVVFGSNCTPTFGKYTAFPNNVYLRLNKESSRRYYEGELNPLDSEWMYADSKIRVKYIAASENDLLDSGHDFFVSFSLPFSDSNYLIPYSTLYAAQDPNFVWKGQAPIELRNSGIEQQISKVLALAKIPAGHAYENRVHRDCLLDPNLPGIFSKVVNKSVLGFREYARLESPKNYDLWGNLLSSCSVPKRYHSALSDIRYMTVAASRLQDIFVSILGAIHQELFVLQMRSRSPIGLPPEEQERFKKYSKLHGSLLAQSVDVVLLDEALETLKSRLVVKPSLTKDELAILSLLLYLNGEYELETQSGSTVKRRVLKGGVLYTLLDSTGIDMLLDCFEVASVPAWGRGPKFCLLFNFIQMFQLAGSLIRDSYALLLPFNSDRISTYISEVDYMFDISVNLDKFFEGEGRVITELLYPNTLGWYHPIVGFSGNQVSSNGYDQSVSMYSSWAKAIKARVLYLLSDLEALVDECNSQLSDRLGVTNSAPHKTQLGLDQVSQEFNVAPLVPVDNEFAGLLGSLKIDPNTGFFMSGGTHFHISHNDYLYYFHQSGGIAVAKNVSARAERATPEMCSDTGTLRTLVQECISSVGSK